ncbi:MAG: SMC-Scp complex subunit ScpB [Paracoccaceae bacterium]
MSGPELPLGDAPDAAETERLVEAVLFASAEALSVRAIAERLPPGSDVAAALDALYARYEGRGVVLERAGGVFAFRTAPDLAPRLAAARATERPLSRAAIETLAIIAYHQPVTRAEIEETRGVAVAKGTLDLLADLGWIAPGKRRDTPGRPGTFVTTDAFLDHFALASTRDLPGLAELRAAGLLDHAPPEASRRPPSEADHGAVGDVDED